MMQRSARTLVRVTLAAFLGITPAAADTATPAAPKPAPEEAPARDASAEVVTEGRVIYERSCAACHGADGTGDGPDASLCETPPRNLREGFLDRYPEGDLVRRILDGRTLDVALDPDAVRARARDVEAIAVHLERLPTVRWDLVERGLEIYVDHCELCHGPYGRAGSGAPPATAKPRDLSDPAFQRGVDDAGLRTLVRHGRKGMPPLKREWSDDELTALIAFVRLLSPGYERYARYCAGCHGEDGRSSARVAGAAPPPKVVFDRDYFARHDAEHVRASVWHMADQKKPAMPHFHFLFSDAQARAIIAYLEHAR